MRTGAFAFLFRQKRRGVLTVARCEVLRLMATRPAGILADAATRHANWISSVGQNSLPGWRGSVNSLIRSRTTMWSAFAPNSATLFQQNPSWFDFGVFARQSFDHLPRVSPNGRRFPCLTLPGEEGETICKPAIAPASWAASRRQDAARRIIFYLFKVNFVQSAFAGSPAASAGAGT